ncbi:MAG: hypothetical protein KGS60_02450 [Verrucomicrobia bacterium]|nr:hypothetical protein [Verrucomicrobiota bacterium]
MRMLLACLLLMGVASGQTAEQAAEALARRADLDEIRWKDPARGAAFRAGIVRATPEGLEVQRGTAKRLLAYDQVGGIRFGLSMGERQLIAEAKPESIPALRVFWEARRLTLGIAGSNVGDFGLALARALRQEEAFADALAIAREIARGDHDPSRKGRALQESETLDFIQFLRTAKPVEIEKRAWSLIESADESNPDLMLLLTGYLMLKEFEALRRLEEENPKWMEDDEVRPARDRHYHRSLDLALYPGLFHPSRTTEAAAGLWQAAQVYRHTREEEREANALEDLLALYPGTARSAEARDRLLPLRAQLNRPAPGEPAHDPAEEEKPKAEKPAEPPPPPKRYNLFED